MTMIFERNFISSLFFRSQFNFVSLLALSHKKRNLHSLQWPDIMHKFNYEEASNKNHIILRSYRYTFHLSLTSFLVSHGTVFYILFFSFFYFICNFGEKFLSHERYTISVRWCSRLEENWESDFLFCSAHTATAYALFSSACRALWKNISTGGEDFPFTSFPSSSSYCLLALLLSTTDCFFFLLGNFSRRW